MGLSPLSDEAQKLYRNAPAMLFCSHALRDVDARRFEQLGEMLGTHWTRESAMQLTQQDKPKRGSEPTKPREKLVIPLLLGTKPEMVEFIGKAFGSPHGIDAPEWYRQDHGEVVEAFDMDRDKFMKIAGMFTPLIAKPG